MSIEKFELTKEFGPICVSDENNESWFLANSIAKKLEYTTVHHMLSFLDSEEKKKLKVSVVKEDISKFHDFDVVSESGFYNAIFNSKSPISKKFTEWFRSQILPAICKAKGSIDTIIEENFEESKKEQVAITDFFDSMDPLKRQMYMDAMLDRYKNKQQDLLNNILEEAQTGEGDMHV